MSKNSGDSDAFLADGMPLPLPRFLRGL